MAQRGWDSQVLPAQLDLQAHPRVQRAQPARREDPLWGQRGQPAARVIRGLLLGWSAQRGQRELPAQLAALDRLGHRAHKDRRATAEHRALLAQPARRAWLGQPALQALQVLQELVVRQARQVLPEWPARLASWG